MSTPLITIFVRHAADCKYAGEEFEKRCACSKHFRWSHNGRQFRKSAGTRSWTEADKRKRSLEDQLAGRVPAKEEAPAQTIRSAMDVFIQSREIKGLDVSTIRKFRHELGRFVEFCEGRAVFVFHGVTAPLLIQFRATWPKLYASTYTQEFVRKRLRVFLNFCKEAGWLERVPKMEPIKIDEPPTMPLTAKEYADILEAVPLEFTNGNAARIRAVIQLMRWSGLAVRDAATLKRSDLIKDGNSYRVTVSRQKTGVPVCVPIPATVGAFALTFQANGTEYLFWDPENCEAVNAAAKMSQNISRVFDRAGVKTEGHMISHRLRDTFAVDLLEKGVSLEDVSKLLGHKSVVTTEKHYAAWVQGRQDRLANVVMSTWEAS